VCTCVFLFHKKFFNMILATNLSYQTGVSLMINSLMKRIKNSVTRGVTLSKMEAGDEVLSVAWIRCLLEVFVLSQEEFQVVVAQAQRPLSGSSPSSTSAPSMHSTSATPHVTASTRCAARGCSRRPALPHAQGTLRPRHPPHRLGRWRWCLLLPRQPPQLLLRPCGAHVVV
jgi:hypothetical protein